MNEVRELLVFRHSYTKKGVERGEGSHLSSEGIDLARRVGGSLGTIDYVCTSSAARTYEAAIAIEDSPIGAASALAAGIQTPGVGVLVSMELY